MLSLPEPAPGPLAAAFLPAAVDDDRAEAMVDRIFAVDKDEEDMSVAHGPIDALIDCLFGVRKAYGRLAARDAHRPIALGRDADFLAQPTIALRDQRSGVRSNSDRFNVLAGTGGSGDGIDNDGDNLVDEVDELNHPIAGGKNASQA